MPWFGRLGKPLAFGFLLLGLVAWRWPILETPPFEDQAIGLWSEACFLAETGFDYYRLKYEERHVLDFSDPAQLGVRSYLISVVPTIIALVMRLSRSTTQVMIVMHCLQLATASALCLLLYSLLRQRISRSAALALCAAMLTTPLFSVQIDLLGPDLAMTLFCLATLAFVLKGRFTIAAFLSCAAFFIKASGALATLAVFIYVGLLFCSTPRGGRRALVPGVVSSGALFVIELLLFRWADPQPQHAAGDFTWPRLLKLPYAWLAYPDVPAWLVLGGAIALLYLGARFRGNRRACADDARPRVAALRQLLIQEPAIVFSWLLIGLNLAMMTRFIAIPRYLVGLLPFVCLSYGYVVFTKPRFARLALAATVLLIGFNLLNRSGRFYPDLSVIGAHDFSHDAYVDSTNCSYLERSHEYLRELENDVGLFRALTACDPDIPIAMPIPYLHYALRPGLGYVTRKLNAYNANDFAIAIQNAERAWMSGDRQGPIYIWFRRNRMTVPPPEPTQQLLFVGEGPDAARAYRRPPPADIRTPQAFIDWYLDETWGTTWLSQRTLARAQYLKDSGRKERAIREVGQALNEDRTAYPELRRYLIDLNRWIRED